MSKRKGVKKGRKSTKLAPKLPTLPAAPSKIVRAIELIDSLVSTATKWQEDTWESTLDKLWEHLARVEAMQPKFTGADPANVSIMIL